MYARIDRASGWPGYPGDRPGPMAFAGTAPGLLGSITLGQLAGPAEVLVTFWGTQAGAAGFAGPHPRPAGPPGRVYEVADAGEGMAAAHPPRYALVPYFDGPQLPEIAAAADRAWRQRLWPAIRGVDGLVAAYLLAHDDLGAVVLQLGSSLEALEAAVRAIQATDLLPGEDPALLPGPDRIELHHVTAYERPRIAVPAAALGASR